MINITVGGVVYPVPSSAADDNWAARQAAFEQALAAVVTTNTADVDALEASVAALQASRIKKLTTNVTPVGTGADTTEDDLMTYALPAATLAVNGQGVRVTAGGLGITTADVTTLRAYFGATLVVSKVLTASQNNAWRVVFEVFRTGATAQIAAGTIDNGGTVGSTETGLAIPSETLSGAVTLKLTGQRASTSQANSITQFYMTVELIP